MSTDRTRRLTPSQLALKLATRDAVRAAGGQEHVARQVGRAQSRISDYCSENVAEFMPLDLVEVVEALGAGAPGAPHITHALARSRSGSFLGAPAGVTLAAPTLGAWLGEVASESSDVIALLATGNLAAAIAALTPRQRAKIAEEAGQAAAAMLSLASSMLTGDSHSALPCPMGSADAPDSDSS